MGKSSADWTTGGHADEGGASRFFQTFEPEVPFRYCPKPSRAERDRGCDTLPEGADGRNGHPTVKPVTLLSYLCRLICPPGGTVLDPFTGSGSTGVAALQEGFSFLGVELEAEYRRIAAARLGYVETHREQLRLF
jgi:site-specific DNA-methyltransferase (adenine-specific)